MVRGFALKQIHLTDVLSMQQKPAVTENIDTFLDGIRQEHKIHGTLILTQTMKDTIIKHMTGVEVWFHIKFMQEKMEHWQFGQIRH